MEADIFMWLFGCDLGGCCGKEKFVLHLERVREEKCVMRMSVCKRRLGEVTNLTDHKRNISPLLHI